jgi:hypothetical protein
MVDLLEVLALQLRRLAVHKLEGVLERVPGDRVQVDLAVEEEGVVILEVCSLSYIF